MIKGNNPCNVWGWRPTIYYYSNFPTTLFWSAAPSDGSFPEIPIKIDFLRNLLTEPTRRIVNSVPLSLSLNVHEICSNIAPVTEIDPLDKIRREKAKSLLSILNCSLVQSSSGYIFPFSKTT